MNLFIKFYNKTNFKIIEKVNLIILIFIKKSIYDHSNIK